MPLSPPAQQLLADTFGFAEARPGQAEVITRLLDGRSTLAVFPTGGGKSLCYQLPALLFDGLTLVVSPLIALMKDQVDFLRSRGVSAARLDSSLSADAYRQLWDDVTMGRTKILYIAPERFQNERFLARLSKVPISLMAIDEAHCISEWGHNFRPDYLKLASMAEQLGVGRVLALTATATPDVAADIRRSFQIAEDDHVHTGFHRPNLHLAMTPTSAADRDGLLLARLHERPAGPTVVYVTLQHTAEGVAKRLAAEGLPARAYHAGMDTDVRTEVQEWFMGSTEGIVVATIAFGMGIDKADIRYVYHYNLPKALENHAQEIGRAGRDGQPSVCEAFVVADDVVTLQNFSFGDTPMPDAVRGLVRGLLSKGDRFDVSKYALAREHDIRQLVVSTLLTYLELEGVLASTAPFYDTFRFQPQRSSAEILAAVDPGRAALLRRLLARAKKARTWFTIDITAASEALDEPRPRLVDALERLQQEGHLVLKVSGVRHGFRVVQRPDDVDALADRLATRFLEAEARDIARTQRVLDLGTHTGCLTNAMLAYFGEALDGPCGHCDRCDGVEVGELPPRTPHAFVEADAAALESVRAETHEALGSDRQLARFLCGLSSPATSRARLRRHRAWGRFRDVPFDEVLAFVEGRAVA